MDREKVLQSVKKAVHQVDDKAEIILFGSRARGDFNKESDWDFLILTQFKDEMDTWEKMRENLFQTELETKEIFNTIVHNKDYWNKLTITNFYKEVQKEGKII